MYLGPVVVELGIVIIKKIKLFISLGLIKELDIGIEVKELEFSNNEKLWEYYIQLLLLINWR